VSDACYTCVKTGTLAVHPAYPYPTNSRQRLRLFREREYPAPSACAPDVTSGSAARLCRGTKRDSSSLSGCATVRHSFPPTVLDADDAGLGARLAGQVMPHVRWMGWPTLCTPRTYGRQRASRARDASMGRRLRRPLTSIQTARRSGHMAYAIRSPDGGTGTNGRKRTR